MIPHPTTLDGERVRLLLQDVPFVSRVVVADRVASTNDTLRALADAGAPAGTVVLAEEQTHGRGRLGSRWHSPRGTGLYLSVLLRPRRPPAELTRWTIGAALKRIADEGRGVVVVLREDESDEQLAARLEAYADEDSGQEHPGREHSSDLRTYGLGAQVLLDLGVSRMRVMGTPKRMLGLSGFGLEVVEYVN